MLKTRSCSVPREPIFFKFKATLTVSLVAAILCAQTAKAEIKGKQVCARLKVCALESLEGQQIHQEVKDRLMSQLNAQCLDSFRAREQRIIDAGLQSQANACASQMLALPCDELLSPSGRDATKACAEFNEAAKKAGIE